MKTLILSIREMWEENHIHFSLGIALIELNIWCCSFTLMLVYHCHKPVFTPKIAIFRRVRMREGGLPLPLTFQYLIFMIWRPSDLNLVMISSLASKCQHFKLRGLQFHSIKWLKNRHPNFKVLAFWSQLRYHDQIQIIRSSYQKNQILKS